MTAEPTDEKLPFILRYRRSILVVALLLCALSVFGVMQLRIDTQPRNLFAAGNDDYLTLDEMNDLFGADIDRILIVVYDKTDVMQRPILLALRQFVARVEEIDTVESVYSIFDIRRDDAPTAHLIPHDRASPINFYTAANQAKQHSLVADRLLSSNGDTMLMIANLRPDITVPETRRLLDAIHAEAAKTCDQLKEFDVEIFPKSDELASGKIDLSVRLTGHSVFRIECLVRCQEELVNYTILAWALSTIVAAILFRRPAAVLIASLGPMVGVLWFMGLMGGLGASLNIFSIVIPAVTLTIGFASSLHLIFHIQCRLAEGDTPLEAARSAYLLLRRACLLTAITTAIGFGSLTVAAIDSIQSFGFWAAIGTLIEFVAVITLIPILAASPLGRGLLVPRPIARHAKLSKMILHLTAPTARYSRLLAYGSIVLCGVLFYGAFQLQPEISFWDSLPSGSETLKAQTHCRERFGGTLPTYIDIRWPEGMSVASPRIRRVLTEVHQSVEDAGFPAKPFSVLNVLKSVPIDVYDYQRIRRFIKRIPEKQLSRIAKTDPDERRLRVIFFLSDLGTVEETALLDKLQVNLEKLQADHPDFQFKISGTALVAGRNLHRIIGDMSRSLFAAAILVFIVMAVVLRSLRLGLISVIPNAFPILLAAGGLVVVGKTLELAAVMTFSFCLGIAVDDTVHFLIRYQRELKKHRCPLAAIERTMSSVGTVLVMTTIIIIVGFMVFSTSVIPSVRFFVTLAAVALIAALLADLVLLPALLLTFAKRERHAVAAEESVESTTPAVMTQAIEAVGEDSAE